jgi:nucleoside-diphosphate-sugar epimerase
MKILLTGASGFVGSSLLMKLILKQQKVSVVVRSRLKIDPAIEQIHVDEIDSQTNWHGITSCSVVIHCAGSAHGKGLGTLEHFRKTNTNGTLHLAKETFKKGMQRFVFISSIGVNGSKTNKPFTENSFPSPCSNYARSKYEAEQGLKKLASELGFELVIVRPPLVYGVKAPGNFGKLVRLVNKTPFLPFALSKNKRSFISVANLADFIFTCIHHQKAANETFCVSDSHDVSIREFTDAIAIGLNKRLIQLPIPVSIFRLLGKITGKSEPVEQLIGDLQVDSRKSRELLKWIPPFTMAETFTKLRIKN